MRRELVIEFRLSSRPHVVPQLWPGREFCFLDESAELSCQIPARGSICRHDESGSRNAARPIRSGQQRFLKIRPQLEEDRTNAGWRSACKSDPLRRGKRTHLVCDVATRSCVVFGHYSRVQLAASVASRLMPPHPPSQLIGDGHSGARPKQKHRPFLRINPHYAQNRQFRGCIVCRPGCSCRCCVPPGLPA